MTEPLAVQTWDEIVDGQSGDAAARVALARLHEAPWLAHLGRPSNRDDEVVRVHGWPDALRMFSEASVDDAHSTGSSGTLNAPFWLLMRRLDRDDTLQRRTADAANHALESLMGSGYDGKIGRAVRAADAAGTLGADSFDTKLALLDYVQRFVRLLFIEIHAGDIAEPRCTYFRDQLGWFVAGLLPCGWDGEWPRGGMFTF